MYLRSHLFFYTTYGNEVTCSTHLCCETQRRRYINTFGTYPEILAEIWYDISRPRSFDRYCRKKHLLWTIYGMKNNVTECNAQMQFKGDMTEKTYRKWKEYILKKMSTMDRVSELQIFLTYFLHLC